MKKAVTIEQLSILALGEIVDITSYDSIVIVNDSSSQPERLTWFLKTLTEYEKHELLAVNDHKGTISFLWKSIPPNFREKSEVEIPDGDIWSVHKNYELGYDNIMKEESPNL